MAPNGTIFSLGITGNTINSIKFTRRGSGAFFDIYAVEVNGAVYVDNGVISTKCSSNRSNCCYLLEQNKVFRLWQYSGDSNDGSASSSWIESKT